MRLAAALAAVGSLVAGCGLAAPGSVPPSVVSEVAGTSGGDPGPLRGELLGADLLVLAEGPLPAELVTTVRSVRGVRDATILSVASVAIADRAITVAGVEVSTYRRYTPRVTAESDPVWRAIIRGEAIVSHQLGQDLRQPPGSSLAFGNRYPLRIGAYATTVPQIDAVVNARRAEQLGMATGNALLVSGGGGAANAVRAAVRDRATVQALTATPAPRGSRQAAYLTGGAVSRAVGSFSYRYFPDGTVQPDPSWVAANVRTEVVPLLGQVTCHRVMLPQLRAALAEVVRTGLAAAIDPGDYGGCYVPRFIGHDPERGLSLHTWGIAVDLNVAANQRGHPRAARPAGRRHLQTVGLRLGRGLAVDRPHALRADDPREVLTPAPPVTSWRACRSRTTGMPVTGSAAIPMV